MATTSRNLRRRSIFGFITALASIAIAHLSVAAEHSDRGTTALSVPSRGVGQAHFTHTAVTYPVDNCNDSGTGSLRDAAGLAQNGDTIDLSHLTCGTLVLTGGEISVKDVVIQGPGQGLLTISGNNQSRIFYHSGTDTLTITGLTLADGYQTGVVMGNPGEDSGGGCIYSGGSVSIRYSTVTRCTYDGTSPSSTTFASGGAIFAYNISLDHSVISANTIKLEGANGHLGGYGGGIRASYSVDMTDSVVSNNWADKGSGGISAPNATVTNSTIVNNSADYVGGISAGPGWLTITGSTISGNSSSLAAGGILLSEYLDPIWGTGNKYSSFSMHNSTVSGNHSDTSVGGANIQASTSLSIDNDTIVRNTSGSVTSNGKAVGLWLFSQYGGGTLENSIVALNTSSDGLGVDAANVTQGGTSGWVVLHGSNNLILTGSLTNGPNAVHGCLRLLPLGNYGGPTQTHALVPSSPAVDAGAATDDPYDQRGLPRVVGVAADLGAYERQKTPADLMQRIDNSKTIDAASRNCIPATH